MTKLNITINSQTIVVHTDHPDVLKAGLLAKVRNTTQVWNKPKEDTWSTLPKPSPQIFKIRKAAMQMAKDHAMSGKGCLPMSHFFKAAKLQLGAN